MKTVFFGTHEFGVTILQGLIDNPIFDIELVITQPDKPVGRKKIMTPPPVKLLAEKHGIPVEQPENLKEYRIQNTEYRIGITAQYGLIIPEHVLNAPKHGIVNVHTSLLPKYRGASPIQSTLIAGEEKTGVTIMKMDEGMDTGDILLQKEVDINPDETYLELDKRLAKLGSQILLEALPKYIDGELKPKTQDESQSTFCKKLTREDGKIDWQKSTNEIYNLYRGLTPWPGIWTTWQNKRLKLLKIKKSTLDVENSKFKIQNSKLYIGCNEGSIEIFELQLEGKSKMDAGQFINGYKDVDSQKVK